VLGHRAGDVLRKLAGEHADRDLRELRRQLVGRGRERAVAGALIGKKADLGDGVDLGDTQRTATFPYVADPQSGYSNTKSGG
jgi:hypothetical protein